MNWKTGFLCWLDGGKLRTQARVVVRVAIFSSQNTKRENDYNSNRRYLCWNKSASAFRDDPLFRKGVLLIWLHVFKLWAQFRGQMGPCPISMLLVVKYWFSPRLDVIDGTSSVNPVISPQISFYIASFSSSLQVLPSPYLPKVISTGCWETLVLAQFPMEREQDLGRSFPLLSWFPLVCKRIG